MKNIFSRLKLYLKNRISFATINVTDATFAVLDTETTGLDFTKDKIVSIAAVKISELRIQEQEILNELVNPERDIPWESVRIHHITNEHVKNKKIFSEIEKKVTDYLQECILVGHNVDFDINFIRTDLPQSNLGTLVKNITTIDTILLSAGLFPDLETYELSYLCNKFNIRTNDQIRHSAIGDCIVTARLFLFLLEEARKQNITTVADIARVCKQGQKLNQLTRNAIKIH